MKKQQLLRDPSVEPTSEVIEERLGVANSAYITFIQGLKNNDIHVNWCYYNDGKVWLGKGQYEWTTVRGTQKATTVFWLSIWEGFFKVTIYIPEKARADALRLTLAAETLKIIESSKKMGKLKFFPLIFDLSSDELFEEIYTVLNFRKKLNCNL